jgi:SAM-dependent methyltransferase
MSVLPGHLGGSLYITHIDTESLEYLINKYDIKTAYDVGCGPGGMVKKMISIGVDAVGIDGDYTIKQKFPFILHDFTSGPLQVKERDFCWCVEFLEHVEEKYMNNYFSVFKKCKIILVTASPKKEGHHHVNVQNEGYWIRKFKERGFEFNQEDTRNVRSKSDMEREFIRETGMVFINKRMN